MPTGPVKDSLSQRLQNGRGAGIATVLLTLLGWSSVPLFIKHFSHAIDMWTSNGWRYGFSALLWAPVLVFGAMRRSLPPGLWKAALVPALFNSTGQICFTAAHYMINPGMLTFSLRLQIIFVAAGAALLFPSERRVIRSAGFITGVALVMLGTLGVVLFGESSPKGSSALGVVIAIAAGLLFACYALSVRKFMHGMPPLTAFAAISQYTAAVMVGLMLVFGTNFGAGVLGLSGTQVSLLLFSSFLGIAMGHVCYYIAIARLGVAVSSGIIQLQPVLVAMASFFLFDERLTGGQWTAGAVALSGAATILYTQHRLMRAVRRETAMAATTAQAAEFKDLPVDAVAAATTGEMTEGTTTPARGGG